MGAIKFYVILLALNSRFYIPKKTRGYKFDIASA